MSEQAGRYQRSFGGLIGSMIVLLLVIAAFVVLREATRDNPDDPVQPVEWRTSASYARDDAPYEVLAPRRLPDGWIATSVRYRPGPEGGWNLVLLTEQRRYVGIAQAPQTVGAMVERYVDEDAVPGQDVTVGGLRWQTFTDAGGDTALVREAGGVTSLVVSTLPLEQVTAFVGDLVSAGQS